MDFGLLPEVLSSQSRDFCDAKNNATETRTSGTVPHTNMADKSSSDARLEAVPQVDLDEQGRFKYILIKLYAKDHKSDNSFKYLVRGYGWAGFHGTFKFI